MYLQVHMKLQSLLSKHQMSYRYNFWQEFLTVKNDLILVTSDGSLKLIKVIWKQKLSEVAYNLKF